MIINKMNVEKIVDTIYKNEIYEADDGGIYCELQYLRDRSSFAGIALRSTSEKNKLEIRNCKEKKVQDISKFEKLYLGCDEDYVEAIKEIFMLEARDYGLEVLFLVYSDVRSSQIIFEELMKKINDNINIIEKIENNEV